MDMIIKKCKGRGIKFEDCEYFLEYINAKYDLEL